MDIGTFLLLAGAGMIGGICNAVAGGGTFFTFPALLAAGDIDTSIDRIALHHYMTWHAVVPPPRTILAGVRKLPPATIRVIEPDGATTDHIYWEPRFDRTPEDAAREYLMTQGGDGDE